MNSDTFQGRRLLVVEDDYLIAMDAVYSLEESGAEVVGPASNVDQALKLIEATPHLDGALLDVNLNGENVFPVADALLAKGIPFAFATGYDQASLPARFRGITRLNKPIESQALATLLAGVWQARLRNDGTGN